MSSSVSGVTSSNSSSIYGSRNVLSGLATGLDTESMIQNAVSGYNTKITSLQQKQTKLTWKQEAYRDITDPMVQFSRKYTSYTSSANLYSASFFNNAVTTTTGGANASKVSASGKTTSDIQILGVDALATKASYSVLANNLLGQDSSVTTPVITGASVDDLSQSLNLSAVSGMLSLSYNNRDIDLSFDELTVYNDMSDFADAINEKLADTSYTNSDGDTVAASTVIEASYANGQITFTNKASNGASVSITGTSGRLASTMDIGGDGTTLSLDSAATGLTVDGGTVGTYLSQKSISITVDGNAKSIQLPEYTAGESVSDFIDTLNGSLKTAFGTTTDDSGNPINKLSVSADTSTANKMALTFTYSQAFSTMSVSSSESSVTDILGLGDHSTSYLDVGKTLEDFLGTDSNGLTGLTANTDGTYDLVINDTKIGSYSSDTALETILSDINNNSDAGVTVSYSKTTNKFLFTAKQTGADGQINIGATTEDDSNNTISNLAAALFGTVDSKTTGYAAGTDAQLEIKINGDTQSITRSSNNFDIDGLSITLKGTFAQNTDDPVTFTTSADADTIVDAVSSMVDDLNAIMKSVHDAYSTQPLTKSDGSFYDPLTDDDESDMSDSAIEKYEEKAKTGLLFGDSDLSSLYSKLLSAVQSSGTAGATLRSMGITTSYSDGLTVLSVDEDALRSTLATDPDSVRDAFTSTTGAQGLMTNLKGIMDSYAATTGATKGILIQKAGSTYSSLSLLNNSMQDQITDLDDQIDKWQDKLSDKIDYYTSLFTKLEELTSQMNSQSSMLSGMLGS